jgi:hypothetical protein
MSDLDKLVNFNNGDGVVRARIVRENVTPEDPTRVFLWAPERGSGYVKLEKGDGTGVPRRAPVDYDNAEPPGGGLTWHYIEDEVPGGDG